ncbi:MAG TPA: hypothetical protein ENI42_00875 [Thermoplasmatales archaeon]|nr:hypothetical protein [Thermoplasmatales archaeon]
MGKKILIAVFFTAIILALPITSVSGSREALNAAERTSSLSTARGTSMEDFEEMINYYAEEIKSIDVNAMTPEEALYTLNTIVGELLEVMEMAGIDDIDGSGAVANAMQQMQSTLAVPLNCADLAAEIAALLVLYTALAYACEALAENAWAHLTLAAIVCGAAAATFGALMQAMSTFFAAGCPEDMLPDGASDLWNGN